MEDRRLRKLGAALFALPVVIGVYLASLGRRVTRTRLVAGLAAGAVIGLVVVVSLPPARSTAVPVSAPPQPVSAELLDTVRTGHGLTTPFTIAFDAPMEPASVAAALRISPDGAVSFGWDAAGKVLTVAPTGHWSPDTLYSVVVAATARAADGGVLEAPVRALILTTHAGSGEITATGLAGTRARIDTTFRILLDRAIPVDAVRSSLHTDPALQGTLTADTEPNAFLFQPAASLAPDATYRVWLDGLVDGEGVPFAVSPSLEVRTVGAPHVIRFRPRNGTASVDRGSTVSVRFTDAMTHASTAEAFRVSVNGAPIAGKISWAEQDHVLVFRPSAALPYGAKVSMEVRLGATSGAGAPLDSAASGTFTVVPKPVVKPPVKTTAPTTTKAISHSGGGGAVAGTWQAVELYYLKLMNCTRTGGWVTSSGACSSPGGRNVAPLMLSSEISSKVSRPYAKLLATRGICNHFIGGTPGDRLRRAGFTSYRWGENLGCQSFDPYRVALNSQLFFQSEKPYNGGHYVNLMNAAYDRAGIGVWVSSGRVRLVVDFYHP